MLLYCSRLFQSTHPHRVRRQILSASTDEILFQSTHPHRVRRRGRSVWWCMSSFNPRTHIGCDERSLSDSILQSMFQSTHPHRVRHTADASRTNMLAFQSTHPHRVRRPPTASRRAKPSFNPRTHIGCDNTLISSEIIKRFQSTHPHRVRHLFH